jgi:hypothetical protein
MLNLRTVIGAKIDEISIWNFKIMVKIYQSSLKLSPFGNQKFRGSQYIRINYFIIQTYSYEKADNRTILMRISNDSTCSSIHSSYRKTSELSLFVSESNEKKILQMQIVKDNHQKKVMENSSIVFPNWTLGEWEYLKINNNSLEFRDHSSFKIYFMTLISLYSKEKFIVNSRTQCGEEYFRCIWLKSLHRNILDFQISSDKTTNLNSYDFCNNKFFDENRWLTQASKWISTSKQKIINSKIILTRLLSKVTDIVLIKITVHEIEKSWIHLSSNHLGLMEFDERWMNES